MQGARGAAIMNQRRLSILGIHATSHPGSKRPSQLHHAAGSFRRGNTWRAVTRSARCYPGWRKRARMRAAAKP